MSGRTALAGRADPGRTEQPAESFAAERETFLLSELLAEIVALKPA
jgi:hypothetical protein